MVCTDCKGKGILILFTSRQICPLCKGKGFLEESTDQLEDIIKDFDKAVAEEGYD